MIIALNGYAQSGKDTVANIIQEIDSSWQNKKFAGKLKQVASLLTGIPAEKFEDQEFKNSLLGGEWDGIMFVEGYGNHETSMTVREFLQKLGTEAIRNNLHRDAWVNALMADYKAINTTIGTSEFDIQDIDITPNWVITDCRMKNEAKAVKVRGGLVVRIIRPGVGPINNHQSEIDLDDYPFDYVIVNDGSLKDLEDQVVDLLSKI